MTNHDFIILPKRAKDLTNQIFGRLSAAGPVKLTPRGVIWLCQCSCGNTVFARTDLLASGDKKSCGCLHKDVNKLCHSTHGKSGTSIYLRWTGLIQRCTNPKDKGYYRYGGRGISVYSPWSVSFDCFFSYVSKLAFYGLDGYSLDRIDNNGNYEPGNVRWATRKEQQRNKSDNKMILYASKNQCLQDWADETGLPRHTIRNRLNSGWSIESSLTVPVFQTRSHKRLEKHP